MRANPEFGQNEELLWFKEAAEARSKRKTDAAAENHGADEAGGDCCDVKVNEEGTRRGLPTPPRHHQCDECKGWHAGSYRWNWTADSRWLCQSCWQRHQGLQHQELQHQALEQAVQMPVPDDDPMDMNE